MTDRNKNRIAGSAGGLVNGLFGGGGGMLGATGAIAANGGFSQADTLMLVSYLMKTPWWLAAAALAAVALDAAFQWVLLRKQEVRL